MYFQEQKVQWLRLLVLHVMVQVGLWVETVAPARRFDRIRRPECVARRRDPEHRAAVARRSDQQRAASNQRHRRARASIRRVDRARAEPHGAEAHRRIAGGARRRAGR